MVGKSDQECRIINFIDKESTVSTCTLLGAGLTRRAAFTCRAALLCLGLVLACDSGALAQVEVNGQAGPMDVDPPKPAVVSLSFRYGVQVGAPGELLLDPVNNQTFIAEDVANPPPCKALRYAVGRDVPWAQGAGTWFDVDAQHGGGHLWVCDVTSPTAFGLRVHLAEMNLAAGAQLVIYDPANPAGLVDGPYEGRGVHDSREMWTLTIFSQTARVEVYIPAAMKGEAAPRDPGVVIDRVQHAYRNFNDVFNSREGACYLDVSCFANWANTARSSAGIGIIGNNSLYCSGTVLQSQNGDLTPYFLTANHCLSTAATAQNSEIYWKFQTAACNGAAPALTSMVQSNVCTLLSTSTSSDYTLLRIEGTIPRNDVFWAGWNSGGVGDGTLVGCVHHPAGTYKRISFGTKASNLTCGNANHIRSDWYTVNGTLSVTEPGSSGSGLFLQSNQQLVGQLHCGPSVCGGAAGSAHDDYGAFSSTFGNISSFLAGGGDDSLEANDSCAAPRSISSGGFSNLIVKSVNEDWYAISVPGGGGTLSVQLSFTHAFGDIDLQLYGTCGGGTLATSTGTANTETINYTNTGATATFFIRVFLFSDTRNTYSMNVSAVAPVPPNNACANAISIGSGTFTGTTVGATNDGPALCGSNSTASPDVWYRYTAPCSGTLKIDTCGSSYDSAISVHTGCPGTAGNQLTCNDDCTTAGFSCNVSGNRQSCLNLAATSGTTYLIRVGGFNGISGAYVLHVVLDAGLPNDNCASATTVSTGTYIGTTCGATIDGTASCGISTGSPDVWYAFTPNCNASLILDTCGSSYDTVLSVLSACGGAELACNDDCIGGACAGFTQSCMSVAVTSGTTYRIRVSGYLGSSGNFVLHVGLAAPVNDTCANATQIIPGTYTGGTCGGTVDGAASCGSSGASNDVWYSILPGVTGLARLDTCGSGYDTVLSVHTACPGTAANQVSCNDDDNWSYGPCPLTLGSTVNAPVIAGNTYYVRVAGFNGSVGNYTLHYTLDPIGNDTCENATPVAYISYPYNNTGATTDGPTEANCLFCCGDLQVNQDLWYTLTAPCARPITIDTFGSSYDTKIAVYAGCPFSNDTAVACNDDFGGPFSSVTFTPVAGVNYRIRVGAYSANFGAGMLNIRTCFADFNCSGTLEVADIFAFLNAWFAGEARADVTGDGLSIQDVFQFLNLWFAGC